MSLRCIALRRLQILALAAGVSWLVIQPTLASTELDKERYRFISRLSSLVDRRQGKQAMTLADEYVQQNRSDAFAYAIRARLSSFMDENEESIKDCDRALALNPNNSLALTTKALSLTRLRRLKDVLALSDKALNISPSDSYCKDDRIEILITLGRNNDAQAMLKSQLKQNPSDNSKRGRLLRILFEEKNYPEVVEQSSLILNARSKFKSRFTTLHTRGTAYKEMGKFALAEKDFLEAERLNPEWPVSYRSLIELYGQTNQKSKLAAQKRLLDELESAFR